MSLFLYLYPNKSEVENIVIDETLTSKACREKEITIFSTSAPTISIFCNNKSNLSYRDVQIYNKNA